MSQPPLGPPPSSPPNDPSPSPRGRGLLVVVALGAVLLGLAGGVLLGSLIFDDAPGSRAAADVEAGCVVVERLDDEGGIDFEKIGGVDEPGLWELGAASQSFVAASKADDDYEEWEKPGDALLREFHTLDAEGVNEALDTLVDMCGDR